MSQHHDNCFSHIFLFFLLLEDPVAAASVEILTVANYQNLTQNNLYYKGIILAHSTEISEVYLLSNVA